MVVTSQAERNEFDPFGSGLGEGAPKCSRLSMVQFLHKTFLLKMPLALLWQKTIARPKHLHKSPPPSTNLVAVVASLCLPVVTLRPGSGCQNKMKFTNYFTTGTILFSYRKFHRVPRVTSVYFVYYASVLMYCKYNRFKWSDLPIWDFFKSLKCKLIR